jgi:hypothetical protein
MGNKILTFKMWEDAAVNSAGSGNIAGIGVGAKGEPGVHMKKKKKKEEEQVKHTKNVKNEYADGSRGPADGWEDRAKTSRNVRKDMWKAILQKGKARLKKRK